MQAASWQDFAFTVGACVLALAGVVIVGWAMWWDRSKGRRRCPRCWYDMSGAVGLVCPECGRDAKKEKRLLRTRRRWRFAAIGVLSLVGASALYVTPIVRREGWAAAPRWVVIVGLPYADEWGRSFFQEVHQRLLPDEWELGELNGWERWVLDRSSRRALERKSAAVRLGARFQVLLHEDAVERAAPAWRGPVVLAAAEQAYAKCGTYVDYAVVSSREGETRTFTALERGVGFRWEAERSAAGGARHVVVWGNEDVTKSWDDKGGGMRWEASAEIAVLRMGSPALTGPPQVLMLIAPWSREVIDPFVKVTWLGREEVGGRLCDRISGLAVPGVQVEMWVDTRTRFVRWIKRGGAFPMESLHDPVADVEVDPVWFDFSPDEPRRSPWGSE